MKVRIVVYVCIEAKWDPALGKAKNSSPKTWKIYINVKLMWSHKLGGIFNYSA